MLEGTYKRCHDNKLDLKNGFGDENWCLSGSKIVNERD